MKRSFTPENCARAFMRTAQYVAGILGRSDIYDEARQIVGASFGADAVLFLGRSGTDLPAVPDRVPTADRHMIAIAAGQVLDTGFMAQEGGAGPPPSLWILLPVAVRGQIESVMAVAFEGSDPAPAHLLEALLGVAAIIGAAMARQRSEQALRGQSKRTRQILEAVGEGVCGLDPAGVVTFANPAAQAILGCEESELVGRRLVDVAGLEGKLEPDSDAPTRREMTLRRKDGSAFPAEVYVTPLPAEDGAAGVVATFIDITERKEAEEQLRHTVDQLTRSNTELERFAYVASHDLQEPVRSVVSFSQLLARRLGPALDDEGRDYLKFMTDAAQRMSDLVNDLLSYSRMSNRPVVCEPAPLAEVVAAAIDNLHTLLEERQATVEVDAMPVVLGDRIQLMELFQNLLGNSVKFSCPGQSPQVRISARREGDWWTVSVADNGIGIAPDYHERIFVIFQRLHAGQAFPGTGMGLAICKRIVEQHGGRIWVESEEGSGASFHFTLRNAP
ncbi:MAG: sensor histidine kinase [Actinomycetota bacterium]